mmetsp:Transcript_30780/g.74464  ORF Transcript_30780/g.74464 Transcript_30780/m.74464 type:complete len:491 (+) Transcript_30780:123-1595(+)
MIKLLRTKMKKINDAAKMTTPTMTASTIMFVPTRSTDDDNDDDIEHHLASSSTSSSPSSNCCSKLTAAAGRSRRSATVAVLLAVVTICAVVNLSTSQLKTQLPSLFTGTSVRSVSHTPSSTLLGTAEEGQQKKALTFDSHPSLSDDGVNNNAWLTSDQLSDRSFVERVIKKDPLHGITTDSPNVLLPNEEDWLLSQTHYGDDDSHQVTIPKRLHKVFLRTDGRFSDDVFDMLSDQTVLNLTKNETTSEVDLTGVTDRLVWAHRSWKVYNPDYEIRYFNLNSCRSYLKRYFHPVMLRAFDCIEAFAGKADLFRYLVVYREGGFYSDWKQECMADHLLDRLASNNITFVAAVDSGLPKAWKSIQNSFIGATPRHPILATAIRIILENIQGRADTDKSMTVHHSAYEMTSTIPLGRAVRSINPPLDVPGGAVLIDFKALWGLRFFWKNEIVIVHKCYDCGTSQNWTGGNNYLHKYEIGEYFCPDGPSIFNAAL